MNIVEHLPATWTEKCVGTAAYGWLQLHSKEAVKLSYQVKGTVCNDLSYLLTQINVFVHK